MKAMSLRILTAIVVVVCSWNPVLSQTKGAVSGRIVDNETGEGLPGVNVVVKGTYYGAATSLDGSYIIRNMNPGVYTVEASMMGYKQVQHTGVKVVAGETTTLDFNLEATVLAFGQEVVVIGQKPAILTVQVPVDQLEPLASIPGVMAFVFIKKSAARAWPDRVAENQNRWDENLS